HRAMARPKAVCERLYIEFCRFAAHAMNCCRGIQRLHRKYGYVTIALIDSDPDLPKYRVS
ncbi:hypothetical protein, partial [Mesorhizobium sp. 98Argb]